MAFYGDEDEMWRCRKHPSKRRRATGVCPSCLRDRLLALCPECANVRPCSACPCSSSASSASSSSSSFASFSRFFSGCDAAGVGTVGTVGRLSNLIDSEPAFRRSTSLSIPFLRSRSGTVAGTAGEFGSRKETPPASAGSARTRYLSLWSVFKTQKSNKCDDDTPTKIREIDIRRTAAMMRSRSVAVVTEPISAAVGGGIPKQGKGKGWHFPTPRSVFRQSKVSKIAVQVHERSPMYRG